MSQSAPLASAKLVRGSVVRVSFDPVFGSEASKDRPAVVVSNDSANTAAMIHAGVITVVPLTSHVEHIYSFETPVPADADNGLSMPSKAQPQQIRTLSVGRIRAVLGRLDHERLAALDDNIAHHLGLT